MSDQNEITLHSYQVGEQITIDDLERNHITVKPNHPLAFCFEHSDGKRVVKISKKEWDGSLPQVSDNIVEAIFELTLHKYYSRHDIAEIFERHGFTLFNEDKKVKLL